MNNTIIAVVSPDKAGRGEREQARYREAFREILDESPVYYSLSRGYYKGAEECSAILSGPGAEELALRLGKEFNQESVLIVYPSGRTFLIYLDGNVAPEFLGVWQEVDSVEGLDSWTLECSTGKRFAVLPVPSHGIPALESRQQDFSTRGRESSQAERLRLAGIPLKPGGLSV